MLVGDPVEALDQASNFLKTGSLDDYYDEIVLQGLLLADTDRRLGRLDDDRVSKIVATVAELTDDLETNMDEDSRGKAVASANVLCIPAGGKLDEAVTLVFAQALRNRGLKANAEQSDALSMSRVFTLDVSAAQIICLCYLSAPSPARVDYAIRRIARKTDTAKILVTRFDPAPDAALEGSYSTIVGTVSAAAAAVAQVAAGQLAISRKSRSAG